MRVTRSNSMGLLLLLATSGGLMAQDAPAPPAIVTNRQAVAPANGQPGVGPAPAYGSGITPQQSEGPTLTGLDEPAVGPTGRDPLAVGDSFIQPGVFVSQGIDTNAQNRIGGSDVVSATHLFGTLALQRVRARTETDIGYVGGVGIYSSSDRRVRQIHDLYLSERYQWRRSQIRIRDGFTYLPEGTFGYGAFGGIGGTPDGLGFGGGLGSGLGGGRFNFFGPGDFGSFTGLSRISNVTIVDYQESLTRRTSFSLAGGYGLLHFPENKLGATDSRQTSAQAGLDYALTRRDRVGVLYGFQTFRFPDFARSSFQSHSLEFLYGHQISRRMDFEIGAGPQWSMFKDPLTGANVTRLSTIGRIEFRYRFPKTSVFAVYDHYTTAGSGIFLGAASHVARVGLTRPLTRVWRGSVDFGFSHQRRVQPTLAGVQANYYNYGFAGVSAHRPLGHHLTLGVGYQFDENYFDRTFCGADSTCLRSTSRHSAGVSLEWRPRPIRLD